MANCDFPRITICQIYSTFERANKNQTFEDLDISAATQEAEGETPVPTFNVGFCRNPLAGLLPAA